MPGFVFILPSPPTPTRSLLWARRGLCPSFIPLGKFRHREIKCVKIHILLGERPKFILFGLIVVESWRKPLGEGKESTGLCTCVQLL